MKTVSTSSRTGVLTLSTPVLVLPAAAFLLPFLLSGPQWLTGTAVNCLILLTVSLVPARHAWPVVLLPGLGALAHGALFGPFTPFLAFFLPVIWAGNAVYALLFLRLRSASAPLAVCAGALVKTGILSASALVFFRLRLVPEIFVSSMSVLQLVTAVAGGLLALAIMRFLRIHE